MSDTAHWWEPLHPDAFWPQGAPQAYTTSAYVAAFGLSGYVPCRSPDREPGYEKIALFVDQQGVPTHAARQLSADYWTSKLGPFIDIEHELTALEGHEYGQIFVILRRRVTRLSAAMKLVHSIIDWVRRRLGY